jgi:hypothetical protein
MASPAAVRHTPGVYQSRPSAARSNTHGENAAPDGGLHHLPDSHAHRPRRHIHSPSIHTAVEAGCGGSTSTRAGGGGSLTSTSADVG